MRKIVLLLGFGPFLLLLFALALWRLWPSAPVPETRLFLLGEKKLRFTSAYLRVSAEPDDNRIDLVALAPDFAPVSTAQVIAPNAEPAQGGRAQIFITLTPAFRDSGGPATPGERYAGFLSPDAQMAEGGLLRRRFDDASPFAGEDLFLAPPDGEEFAARCPRPKIPTDGLPNSCLADFKIEGVAAQMRFDSAWLPQWSRLRANLFLLVRSAVQP